MITLARMAVMKRFGTMAAALLLAPFCGMSHGEDWPHWNGVRRNGTSAEKGLLQKWPEGGPALKWRVDKLGGGDSAPSVANGKIYGMGSREGKEIVWALAEKDGKVLWHPDGGRRAHLCIGYGWELGVLEQRQRKNRVAKEPDQGICWSDTDVELP